KEVLAAVFKSFRVFLVLTAIFMPLTYTHPMIVPVLMIVLLLLVSAYLVVTSWQKATRAQWAIIAGLFLTFIWLVLTLTLSISYQTTIFPYSRTVNIAIYLAFPLAL